VQAGFLAIDPRNGQIKAWVGSRDFADEPFDHVQQSRRQPGSTFKPFVYGAAFANGAKPTDTFIDQPVEIQLKGGEIWRPNDDVPPSGKPMTLRDALTFSRNRITAQMMEDVGPDKVVRLARAMGVRDGQLDAVPSLALGTSPVTIKEMVSAYSTIANDGAYLEPRMVTSIEDHNGNVLAQFQPATPEQALPAAADRTLIDVMRDVVNRGTGASIRSRFGIRADVAGKTGTTQDNADGWFILMHPQLVAGAWVGFDDGRVTLGSNYWGEGAHTALPIVGDFYQRALRARLIDTRARFATDVQPGILDQFRDKLHTWIAHLFGSKPPVKAPVAPVRHASPKAAPLTPALPVAPVTPQATPAPREMPPLIGEPASASRSASSVGSSGMAASAATNAAPPRETSATQAAPAANGSQSFGTFPSEAPGSSPTPTPDVPEAPAGANAD
jgi:penicillin-binding protein 1A